MNRPQLVRQRQSHDCGIACLAMLLGVTLEEAGAAYDRVYPGARSRGRGVTEGLAYVELDVVLAEEGLATARLWQGPRDNRRVPWPPAPWADLHLVQAGTHFVVLLRDGTVLDPARGEASLTAYDDVQSIAAVVPTERPQISRVQT